MSIVKRLMLALLVLMAGLYTYYVLSSDVKSKDQLPVPTAGIRPIASCDALPLDELLFPKGYLYPSDEINDQIARRDYLPYVAAMSEPSLSCGTFRGATVRLLRIETNGSPQLVKLSKSEDGQVTLKVVVLQAPSWKGPLPIALNRVAALTGDDWNRVQNVLNQTRYWELRPSEDWGGWDGSAWFLEVRQGETYNAVVRLSPKDGPFREAADVLLALAELQKDDAR